MRQSYERRSPKSTASPRRGRRGSGAGRPEGQAPEVTAAIENYLKSLDELSTPDRRRPVQVGELAQAVGVTPGTVTSMLRRLAEAGLADYERYAGATLTSRGRAEARRVVRRHRIIELFLVEILGLDWSEVHDEAERLEHALSDKVLDRLDALLRRPTVDPHGDPIPDLDGTVVDRTLLALADLRAGAEACVARVLDQSSAFLRFIDEAGLRPGTRLEVLAVDRAGETLRLCLLVGKSGCASPARERERTISLSAAWKVMVEEARGPGRRGPGSRGPGRRGPGTRGRPETSISDR